MPPRARKPSLKVVKDDAPPRPKSRPLTVRAAADSGVRRDLLVALRARIAVDIDNPNTPARDLAALSRRLLEIVKDIEALDAEGRWTTLARRQQRPTKSGLLPEALTWSCRRASSANGFPSTKRVCPRIGILFDPWQPI